MKRISYSTYLQLVGLLTLAADHRKALSQIERSALTLLGEPASGHVADEVWGGSERGADGLLFALGMAVEREEVQP